MFKCQYNRCKQHTRSGEQPVRMVLETRVKEYPEREKAYRMPQLDWNGKPQFRMDPGGVGSEIVKEGVFHALCAEKVKAALLAAQEKKLAKTSGNSVKPKRSTVKV